MGKVDRSRARLRWRGAGGHGLQGALEGGRVSVSRMAEGDVGGVIADPLGISRVTARRALQVLAEEGAITRSRGAGTFIAAP